MDTVRHRDAVPDPAKLHFSGRLSAQQRNPEGLAAVLSSFFAVEASIEEFAGRYVNLPEQYRLKLGVAGPEGPGTAMLGLSQGGAVVGGKVYDAAGAIRIRLGPMSLKQYVKFLPGTATHERLVSWVKNYLGDELWWECVLVLRDREVPRTRLGGRPGEGGAMLGWTSWVFGDKKPTDRADVTIRAAR
jgi:type VI secretion system protein ImpH